MTSRAEKSKRKQERKPKTEDGEQQAQKKILWENLNKQTTGMGGQKRTRKRMGKGKKRLIDNGEDQKGRKETRKLIDEQQAKEKFAGKFKY